MVCCCCGAKACVVAPIVESSNIREAAEEAVEAVVAAALLLLVAVVVGIMIRPCLFFNVYIGCRSGRGEQKSTRIVPERKNECANVLLSVETK